MPTDVIKTIGATSSPTTPDYTTLQAWEDAIPANLVTADERWIGECLDQGEFTGTSTRLNISGQTVDSTRYIILRCASGASFKDKSGVRTAALLYNASNGVAVRVTGDSSAAVQVSTRYTRVEGMQLSYGGNYGNNAINLNGIDIQVSQCILRNTRAAGGQPILSSSNTNVVSNCLLEAAANGSSGRALYYGCTFVRTGSAGGTGIFSQYNQSVAKNCAVFNFTTLRSGTLAAGSDYNATDLASAWGTGLNNLNSLTFADQFENSTNDFRAKSTGNLQAGTPDATNTPTDITGLTRDATTPWIGCWEVDGGGGGGITADVPVAVINLSGIAAATAKQASVPAGLVDLAAPALGAAKLAAVPAVSAEFVGVAPAVTKAAPVPPGELTIAAIAPATSKLAALAPVSVAIAGVAPTAIFTAAVPSARIDFAGVEPATSKSAALTPATIAISALAPTTSSDSELSPAVIAFAGVAPATSKAASVPAAAIDLTAPAINTSKSAAVDAAQVEFVGLAPATAKSASVLTGLVAFTAVALVFGDDASPFYFRTYVLARR